MFIPIKSLQQRCLMLLFHHDIGRERKLWTSLLGKITCHLNWIDCSLRTAKSVKCRCLTWTDLVMDASRSPFRTNSTQFRWQEALMWLSLSLPIPKGTTPTTFSCWTDELNNFSKILYSNCFKPPISTQTTILFDWLPSSIDADYTETRRTLDTWEIRGTVRGRKKEGTFPLLSPRTDLATQILWNPCLLEYVWLASHTDDVTEIGRASCRERV